MKRKDYELPSVKVAVLSIRRSVCFAGSIEASNEGMSSHGGYYHKDGNEGMDDETGYW